MELICVFYQDKAPHTAIVLTAPEYESDITAQDMQNRADSLGCG